MTLDLLSFLSLPYTEIAAGIDTGFVDWELIGIISPGLISPPQERIPEFVRVPPSSMVKVPFIVVCPVKVTSPFIIKLERDRSL